MRRPHPVGVAVLTACALALSPTPAAAQESDIQFHDGLVTLVARDMAVRAILSQWGRTGRSTVVNADKVEGPLVTLQLVDVPEREALAILLRNAGGYLTAARHDFEPGASVFDRIVIVATRAVGGSASQAAPEFALPPTSTASAAAEQQAVANESAEPIVYGPRPATVPVPGQPFTFVAPPQPARPGSSAIAAPVGSPLGGGGTARPGEVPVQQPPTRISPGPPRPKS